MKSHYFISSCDGALHDTRDPNWSKKPLRLNYSCAHGKMQTLGDVKATLRAGAYAWPGGYPMYLITADGGALSFDAALSEFRQIAWDWLNNANIGWRVIGCAVNYEDPDLYCDHTGEKIESAYT